MKKTIIIALVALGILSMAGCHHHHHRPDHHHDDHHAKGDHDMQRGDSHGHRGNR